MSVQQRFSWDPRKNRTNIVKHYISFSRAAKIFDGPRLKKEDPRRNYGEKRMLALGRSEGRILRVVYTRRDACIHIISARKANTDERAEYIRRTQSF